MRNKNSFGFSEWQIFIRIIRIYVVAHYHNKLHAIDFLKSPGATLSPMVFGKWMNISASTLANYWRQKPEKEENIQHKTV